MLKRKNVDHKPSYKTPEPPLRPPIKIQGRYSALFDYIQTVLLHRGVKDCEISIITALANQGSLPLDVVDKSEKTHPNDGTDD